MKIVDIRQISVPLEGAVSNAVVSFAEHDVSLVAVITDVIRAGKPVVGYGFNSIGRFAQSGILRDRLIPRLLSADPASLLGAQGFDCEAVARTALRNEKPGGHGDRAAALGALELAFWDLNAKLADEPAYATIGRAFGRTPSDKAAVYAAGGYYYPEDGLDRLKAELEGYIAAGFDAFKIKIGGASLADDMKRIQAALQACGTGARLAVDANGRFDFDTAMAYGREIEPLGLRWYEEIGDPLDYALNAKISANYAGAIATGENLFSTADVRNLLNFAGMRPGKDIFQMDAGLSYGLTEFGRIIALMEAHGFDRAASYPHGGHLINLHIVTGMNLGGCEAYPTVFQPFGGYSPQCEIGGGFIRPADHPGFGLEAKPNLKPHLDKISA
ncbi:enolase superfamily enzyme related to L-alanine-DL-glutamate epimerase [Caulobacter sp. AP07]|uniref:enolase C-terminal domain-like protein n=1 Tax=Caulobacter sp. AP07 TaxID=1144304 RepID=UPI0002720C6A|nr:enolase C-terminal domain-like protein [Caulobacter sp. AP07]EJL27351.1 enolase superfamily enzyme related to L-alanine-DL-glutamate epimerase [Caulobacter sp. AP07]